MNRIEIGVVARPHGVHGEMRIHLHNRDSRALDDAEYVYIGGIRHTTASVRVVKGAVLLRLEGVADRTQVEALRGKAVELDRDQLDLSEDEVLLIDLVGCQALLADGTVYGEIVEVIFGVQDRLVIRLGDIERELPLVDAFVQDIDIERGQVLVDPPQDLPEWPV